MQEKKRKILIILIYAPPENKQNSPERAAFFKYLGLHISQEDKFGTAHFYLSLKKDGRAPGLFIFVSPMES